MLRYYHAIISPLLFFVEFAVASETVDWSQAQTTCQGQRGNFASVLNDKDAQAIAEAFPLGSVTVYCN